MPKLNFLKPKKKKNNFIIIEIGLEKITCAIFEKEEKQLKLLGIGKKRFSSQDEVFDTVLEALDSLAAIVPDLPTDGILGISGGSLETVTTIARYQRKNSKKPIKLDETQETLDQVVENLDKEDKKVFFSIVSSANIDGVRVSNPLGLKGEKVELACFAALKDTTEIELLDRLMSEIDVKIEKIAPTSYAVAKLLAKKNLRDVLIFRVGKERSELTVMQDGHISEILPVSIGAEELDLLPVTWEVAIKKFDKDKKPDLVWLFADNDQVDLEKIKKLLEEFSWRKKLDFELDPRVEIAGNIQNFSSSDIGIYALSQQEVE